MNGRDVVTVLMQGTDGIVHARTFIDKEELVDDRCSLENGDAVEIDDVKGVPVEDLCPRCIPRIQAHG